MKDVIHELVDRHVTNEESHTMSLASGFNLISYTPLCSILATQLDMTEHNLSNTIHTNMQTLYQKLEADFEAFGRKLAELKGAPKYLEQPVPIPHTSVMQTNTIHQTLEYSTG